MWGWAATVIGWDRGDMRGHPMMTGARPKLTEECGHWAPGPGPEPELLSSIIHHSRLSSTTKASRVSDWYRYLPRPRPRPPHQGNWHWLKIHFCLLAHYWPGTVTLGRRFPPVETLSANQDWLENNFGKTIRTLLTQGDSANTSDHWFAELMNILYHDNVTPPLTWLLWLGHY